MTYLHEVSKLNRKLGETQEELVTVRRRLALLMKKIATLQTQFDAAVEINDQQDIDNADLRKELAEIKEKYRWRKQSEEPAPEAAFVEVYNRYNQNEIIYGKFVGTDECWRPLDAPKEEKND